MNTIKWTLTRCVVQFHFLLNLSILQRIASRTTDCSRLTHTSWAICHAISSTHKHRTLHLLLTDWKKRDAKSLHYILKVQTFLNALKDLIKKLNTLYWRLFNSVTLKGTVPYEYMLNWQIMVNWGLNCWSSFWRFCFLSNNKCDFCTAWMKYYGKGTDLYLN